MNKNWSLFVDVDGTIFDNNPRTWDKNIHAFHRFSHEFNLNRFIATGRHPTHMGTILTELNLTHGGITMLNGGMAVCDGKIIAETKFSDDIARTIYDYLVKHDYSFFIYMKDRVRYTHIRNNTHNYPRFAENYTGKDMSIPGRIENFEEVIKNGGAYKFLFITEGFTVDDEICHILNDLNLTHGFSYPSIYEINPNGIDKGVGVKAIVNHLGLDINKTMGIGDGENDLGLAKQCKFSVAMNNGAPRLKENTTKVAPEKGFVSALVTMKDLLAQELEKEKK